MGEKSSFVVHEFITPKAGLEESECEDAIRSNVNTRRFCVADGAGECFGCRCWAQIVAAEWTRPNTKHIVEPTKAGLQHLAERAGKKFDRYWRRRSLPWYAEEKARSGAFASFLGLSFDRDAEGNYSWQAIALGDACLIVRNGTKLHNTFPLSDITEFDKRPVLLPSNRSALTAVTEQIITKEDGVNEGDTYFLLTDAIAAWFLRASVSDEESLVALDKHLDCESDDALRDFVRTARQDGSLRNDDVGILRVKLI